MKKLPTSLAAAVFTLFASTTVPAADLDDISLDVIDADASPAEQRDMALSGTRTARSQGDREDSKDDREDSMSDRTGTMSEARDDIRDSMSDAKDDREDSMSEARDDDAIDSLSDAKDDREDSMDSTRGGFDIRDAR